MRNFIQTGDNVSIPAPASVSAGGGVLSGALFGIASGDAETGAPVVIVTRGVFEMPKPPTDDIAVGAAIYWDDAAKVGTVESDGNSKVGAAIAAAGVGTTSAKVRLNGAL